MKLLSVLGGGFVLMVSLPKNSPEMAAAAVQAGARCLKVHINCHHFASDTRFGSWSEEKAVIGEILAAAGDVPVGIVTGETEQPSPADLEEIVAAGFDFWDLFGRYAPAEYLDLPLGKMVAVDSSWTPALVQHLGRLGVDVIESSIIPRDHYRSGLSLVDLATYAHLAESSPIPILIPTQKAVRPDQVRLLQRAGAAGITIGAVVTGLFVDSLRRATESFTQALA